jgi:C4-dicarboxylate-specific signal transduction histidine kinase
MDDQLDLLRRSGLQFFGEMSAANAHEIKNALAVINENAGLLEDLVGLAEKGAPLDLSRLKRVAAQIKQQVARADHIAKSTNRFAHSVDSNHRSANLEQALMLVMEMVHRFATLRDVHLQLEPIEATITLPVRPFILLHLLWLCLHACIKTCTAGNTLKIAASRANSTTEIRYGPLIEENDSLVSELRASPEIAVLLRTLNGHLKADTGAAVLILTFQ